MMKKISIIAGLAFLAATPVQAYDFGVGVKAGTLGVGAEVSMTLTQTINARLALTSINSSYDDTLDIDDGENVATVDATLDLDFGASALLFDWYVFDGTFHVTGGLIKNSSAINLSGTLTNSTVTFNNQTYNVSDFVDPSLSGKISMGSSAQPYLGIGWGRKADDNPGLSLSFELGVVLLDPSVSLQAPQLKTGNAADQQTLDDNVAQAEAAAEDELSALKAWPVISLGLNYAF
jgi:hypothetical protein